MRSGEPQVQADADRDLALKGQTESLLLHSAFAARIDAGETPADVALDYELTTADIEQAAVYERAA